MWQARRQQLPERHAIWRCWCLRSCHAHPETSAAGADVKPPTRLQPWAEEGEWPLLLLLFFCRVEVYEVPRGAEPWGRRVPLAHADVPDGSAVKGMAWVGPHLVLCTGLRYLLVAPGQQGGQVSIRAALLPALRASPGAACPRFVV